MTEFQQQTWGDLECSGGVTAVDALNVLRNVVALAPVTLDHPCPDVGEPVHVTIPASP